MILTDAAGREIGYIPIRLTAGEETAPINLRATPTSPAQRLRATYAEKVRILGRVAGVGAYLDLYEHPLSLSAFYGGTGELEIKVAASADVSGLLRAAQFLGVSERGAADY
jgi:hypothetical protein